MYVCMCVCTNVRVSPWFEISWSESDLSARFFVSYTFMCEYMYVLMRKSLHCHVHVCVCMYVFLYVCMNVCAHEHENTWAGPVQARSFFSSAWPSYHRLPSPRTNFAVPKFFFVRWFGLDTVYMYVWVIYTYVCVYAYEYVCMYVFLYVCTYVCVYICTSNIPSNLLCHVTLRRWVRFSRAFFNLCISECKSLDYNNDNDNN